MSHRSILSAGVGTPLLALTLVGATVAACSSDGAGDPTLLDEPGAELLGGETTIFDTSGSAYTFPARNLSRAHREDFALGDHFFNRNWVIAPASTSGNDGLGPTFNAVSCSTCHFKDGRGAPEVEGNNLDGVLFRLSVPGDGGHGAPLDEPVYGGQLNPKSIPGVPAEGLPTVVYEDVPGTYVDGEPYVLHRPVYAFADLAFGPLAAGTMTSPRVAPGMIGLGLLEAVPEETLLSAADEGDKDGDGVSGRPNYVWDEAANGPRIGRFGWKANQPSVRQQTAGAFLGDIGITTSLFPKENCPTAQEACGKALSGGETGTVGEPELRDSKLDAVVSYALTLAVPARREWTDATVRRGERLFGEARCSSCHTPKMKTGDLPGFPELSGQTIRPYSDLLLHDMGDGLADGRPDFQASGSEWRTPPLWGLGLLHVVSRHTRLLHDGRARDEAEAILWHGGEGEKAREAFRAMPKVDREALLAFLRSL